MLPDPLPRPRRCLILRAQEPSAAVSPMNRGFRSGEATGVLQVAGKGEPRTRARGREWRTGCHAGRRFHGRERGAGKAELGMIGGRDLTTVIAGCGSSGVGGGPVCRRCRITGWADGRTKDFIGARPPASLRPPVARGGRGAANCAAARAPAGGARPPASLRPPAARGGRGTANSARVCGGRGADTGDREEGEKPPQVRGGWGVDTGDREQGEKPWPPSCDGEKLARVSY